MKSSKFIITYLLLYFTISAFSQTLNTRKWRKSESDTLQNGVALLDEKKFLTALPLFENLFKQHPKEEYIKYCYGVCALSRSDKHEIALTLLNEMYLKNKKIYNIELDLAVANHLNLNFDEALVLIDKYLTQKKISIEDKTKALQLKQYCINGKYFLSNPSKATITNAGNILNSENEEYVPVISADENKMIFTYKGKESMGGLQTESLIPSKYGFYFEDAYQSLKVDNVWTKPTPILTINTIAHDAPIAISADGLSLFVYRDNGEDHGDIYISNFVNGEWSNPKKLRGEVNSYSWEGSCSMTADGKQLYFSSERGGGYGGKDIYRATLLPDSTWGNVINLGDSINTNLDDDAPFIHPDGVTLFYSSKAKNSMGGFDIFQTQLNLVDSSFSKPINLGYPINTPDDDIYYVLSANGERGYYASGKQGGFGLKDIYTVYPGYVGKKPSVFIVKGKITVDDKPVEAEISVLIVTKDNKVLGDFKSNSENGNYLISLPSGADFKLIYKYKSFPYKTLDVNTISLVGYDEKINDLNFTTSDTIKPKAELPKEIKEEPKKEIDKQNKVLEENTEIYAAKYGDIKADSLIFRVQIAAYQHPKNYQYKHLNGLGIVENLLLNDGITRITIGGNFYNLKAAFAHNNRVIAAGQKDAFVTAIYKGKRLYLEELEKMGIFK
ncbi:MAG: TolB family protein [Bacteroidota bacterium]